MRYISSQLAEGPTIRFVGLCTSLANAKDLGEWIGASSHGLYNFPPGESYVHAALVSWRHMLQVAHLACHQQIVAVVCVLLDWLVIWLLGEWVATSHPLLGSSAIV